MNTFKNIFYCFFSSLILFSCQGTKSEVNKNEDEDESKAINLLTDHIPLNHDGDVNAVIEIPAGTIDKWELNKSDGQVEWETVNDVPRVVNYLGYPGNYGMIPRTLLPKDEGGDGDPLDILVLGPPEDRGSLIKCKLIGILYLFDRGEKDDKLIAISSSSPLYHVNDIEELDEKYIGLAEIIKLWFTNYKGPGKMISNGYGNRNSALEILKIAIDEYAQINAEVNPNE